MRRPSCATRATGSRTTPFRLRRISCPRCSAYAEPGSPQPWSDWSATAPCGKSGARSKSSIVPWSSKGPASVIRSSASISVRSILLRSNTRRSAAAAFWLQLDDRCMGCESTAPAQRGAAARVKTRGVAFAPHAVILRLATNAVARMSEATCGTAPGFRSAHPGYYGASLLRNDRQQQVVLLALVEVDGGLAAVDLDRAVARVVVQERAAAGELVLHVGQPPAAAAGVDIVAAAHRERHAITGRHDDAGRPDLDVELIDLAALERLLLAVRVIGAEGQAQLLVEPAVRRAQPALRDRRVGIERALEHDLLHVLRQHAHDQEQIGVLGR